MFIFNVFLSFVLADFIMGLYHWIKDTYGSPFTPIIGKIFIYNSILHHHKPRLVIKHNNINLFINSAIWSSLLFGPLYCIFRSNFIIYLFLFISSNEIIHKYAHMFDKERPRIINFLQKLKIIQNYQEHHIHHTYPHNSYYCPMSNLLNYPLERINFWRTIEYFAEILGIKPRNYEYKYVNGKLEF